jgi:hypothetical protein
MIIWFIFAGALGSASIVLLLMARTLVDRRSVFRTDLFERPPAQAPESGGSGPSAHAAGSGGLREGHSQAAWMVAVQTWRVHGTERPPSAPPPVFQAAGIRVAVPTAVGSGGGHEGQAAAGLCGSLINSVATACAHTGLLHTHTNARPVLKQLFEVESLELGLGEICCLSGAWAC